MVVDLIGRTVAVSEERLLLATVRHLDGDIAVMVTAAGDVLRVDATKTIRTADLVLLRATAREMCAALNTWWVAGQSSVAAAVGATTSETTLATITIPGGALGANGRFRVTTFWEMNNNANNKTFRVRYSGAGGSALVSQAFTTQVYYRDEREVCNQHSESSQVWHSGFSVFGTGTAAIGTSAVNTASDTTVVITGQKANSGDTLSLRSYRVELLHAA